MHVRDILGQRELQGNIHRQSKWRHIYTSYWPYIAKYIPLGQSNIALPEENIFHIRVINDLLYDEIKIK